MNKPTKQEWMRWGLSEQKAEEMVAIDAAADRAVKKPGAEEFPSAGDIFTLAEGGAT